MEKVDAHVHVFDRLSEAYPREVSALAPADRTARAEDLLREMDQAGIARAVLIDMGGTRLEHHRYVTHCVRQWPDRFTATGLVDMDAPDPPSRLGELFESTGIEGIRLTGVLGDPSAETPEAWPVYSLFQRAGELGLNINLYCPGSQVTCLEKLIRAFPEISISLDHLGICPSTSFSFVPDRWGRPRFDREPIPPTTYPHILALARYPNVYIKVSGEYAFSKTAYPYADIKPMVEQIYRAYGPKRMMWATDFPWISENPGYQQLARLLDYHLPDIPPAEKGLIMGGNALSIWFKRR